MKCPNCKKDVSEDSLFCEHCGAKIEKPKEAKKSDSPDDNAIKKQIIDHLEFIGYDVKANNATGSYFGKHNSKPNMIINFRGEAGISFVVFYNIDPKKIEKNKSEAYRYINLMNNRCLLSSFSINEQLNNLVCAAWFPNTYSKKIFADFFDNFENDIRRAIQIEGALTIFG